MMEKNYFQVVQILKLIIFSSAIIFSSVCAAVEKDKRFSFGIVPQQAASKLAKTWAPVLDYLQKQTGYGFNFSTAKNIPTFETRLKNGEYDFAYMNPYHYVLFGQEPGYIAFAKAKDKQIHGIVVVRKDSPYKDLRDLSGHNLAFPSPLAFAASILTQHELKKRHISYTPVYVASHDSVYRNVFSGNFVSGGGVVRTLKSIDPTVGGELRILYKTSGYTPHAFAVHPRVPEEIVRKVVNAFENMGNSAIGRLLLESLKLKGIEAAKDNDWDDVRQLVNREL